MNKGKYKRGEKPKKKTKKKTKKKKKKWKKKTKYTSVRQPKKALRYTSTNYVCFTFSCEASVIGTQYKLHVKKDEK